MGLRLAAFGRRSSANMGMGLRLAAFGRRSSAIKKARLLVRSAIESKYNRVLILFLFFHSLFSQSNFNLCMLQSLHATHCFNNDNDGFFFFKIFIILRKILFQDGHLIVSRREIEKMQFLTNSPNQFYKKFIEASEENLYCYSMSHTSYTCRRRIS